MPGVLINGVTKSFGGAPILSGVSLEMAEGEFIALVGPSGCGKSTLMRIAAGIEQPDQGRIEIAGRDVTRRRAADRDVAMVFQSYALYPHLTAAENIAVPLAMRRLNGWQRAPFLGRFLPGTPGIRQGIQADVQKAGRALGLAGLLDRKPGQLSGGQRQRVALARAMVRQPKLFLMDEPLSNLDASLRVQTRREIVEIHRRSGAATLYVTHDQSEALTMADRVAVMLGGHILQVATPEAIYNDPADLRVATFIGSPRINTLPAEAEVDGIVRVAGLAIGLRAAPGPLTLAVRPEDLHLASSGLPARVEAMEFLGESLLLHLRHPESGSALVLRLPPEGRSGIPGDGQVFLGFDAGKALLFDAAGRRCPSMALGAELAHV